MLELVTLENVSHKISTEVPIIMYPLSLPERKYSVYLVTRRNTENSMRLRVDPKEGGGKFSETLKTSTILYSTILRNLS
jgi:hypothetical protein